MSLPCSSYRVQPLNDLLPYGQAYREKIKVIFCDSKRTTCAELMPYVNLWRN